MNRIMRSLLNHYEKVKLNLVKLPNGMEVPLQSESSNFFDIIYPFISEKSRILLLHNIASNNITEHEKAIKRCISYFKRMRNLDNGIIIISSEDLQKIITMIKLGIDKLKTRFQVISIDGQTAIMIIEKNSECKDLLINSILGDSFATFYHREGTELFVDKESIISNDGFRNSDYLVISDIIGELTDDLFLADICERLIHRDKSIEKTVKKNLSSRFFTSLRPQLINKRYLLLKKTPINTFQKLIDAIYKFIVLEKIYPIWNMTFDCAYLFYEILKEEDHEDKHQ